MRIGKWFGGFFLSAPISSAVFSLLFLIKLVFFACLVFVVVGFTAPKIFEWMFPEVAKRDAIYLKEVERKRAVAEQKRQEELQAEREFNALPKEEQEKLIEQARQNELAKERKYWEDRVQADKERVERAEKYNEEQRAIQAEKDRIREEVTGNTREQRRQDTFRRMEETKKQIGIKD